MFVASYGCDAPSCSVGTEGKMKGSVVAGLNFRPGASSASARPAGRKKPKLVLVGRSKTKIPGGATRKIKLSLNKVGAAVLEKRGQATIEVTLTAKIAGQAKVVTSSHTIRVFLKKPKKPKH